MRQERGGIIRPSRRGIHLSHGGRAPPPPQPDPSGRRGGPCVAAKATGTMQLGLVALAMVFLSSMGHSDVLKLSKARRQRRGEFSLSQLVFYLLFFFLSSTAAFRFCGLSHSGDRPLNI